MTEIVSPLTAAKVDASLPTRTGEETDAALRDAAKKLEAGFLAEMLKAAGLSKTSESFGGGAGEDHFASFLRQEQAKAMVENGGIGLSEALFHSLKEQANEHE